MTTDNTSAPPLDLAAIEARASITVTNTTDYLDAVGDGGHPDEVEAAAWECAGARDTLALVARVRELEALVAAARRGGAEAMREAVVAVLTERARWHEPAPRDESCEAIAAEVRALPLPEAPR